MNNDVVITGIGVVGPHGTGIDSLIERAGSGAPKFSPWPEAQDPPTKVAAIANVADFPKGRYFSERQLRLMDRAMMISSCAAGMALEDAGYATDTEGKGVPSDTATFFGTARAEQPSLYKFISPLLPGNSGRLTASEFPLISRNISCGQIAIRFGLQGHSSVLASGQLASLEAINRAYDFIRDGRSTIALAGGFEALSKYSLYFARHYYGTALSGANQQFFGFGPGSLVPSEGACVLVLESAWHAAARGARIYARIDGWYAGRFGKSAPADTLRNAWARLLHKIGSTPRDIGLISAAAGGSNRLHEVSETAALASLCSDLAADAGVIAARSLSGEGESWTSALQVALAARLLSEKRSIPTWNLAADVPHAIAQRSAGGSIVGSRALVSGIAPSGAYSALHLSLS